jgi:hypothetical protein
MLGPLARRTYRHLFLAQILSLPGTGLASVHGSSAHRPAARLGACPAATAQAAPSIRRQPEDPAHRHAPTV